MKKHLRAFLGGLVLLAPFAATFYVLYKLAAMLGGVGVWAYGLWDKVTPDRQDYASLGGWAKFGIALGGAMVMLTAIWAVGLLARTLLMDRIFRAAERLITHVPGVKTIYESIRDLLKLFGGDSKKMGKVVLYRPGGGDVAMLGVLTNQSPAGLATLSDHKLVAVYLPFGFMLGGQVLYVPRKYLTEIDIPVEQALKICATAETGLRETPATEAKLSLPAQTTITPK